MVSVGSTERAYNLGFMSSRAAGELAAILSGKPVDTEALRAAEAFFLDCQVGHAAFDTSLLPSSEQLEAFGIFLDLVGQLPDMYEIKEWEDYGTMLEYFVGTIGQILEEGIVDPEPLQVTRDFLHSMSREMLGVLSVW